MSTVMAVLLNGIAQLEYDRNKLLPQRQQEYLHKMDEKMAAGITLEGQAIADPDVQQRAQFVAQNLAQAIRDDDEPMAAALTSWLANRLPELKQVKIADAEDGFSIELVFDEEYGHQVAVQFDRLH